jgi:hypothetical protein
MADEADTTHRDHNLYRGIVTNNVDAAKMGRVRVRVPGVFEPDALCECVMPGSPFNQGMFVVPAVGAEVLVGFLQGEYDSPVVLGGFVPPVIAGGSRSKIPAEDLPRLLTLENEDWRVVIGQKDTKAPFFSIESQLGGDVPQMRIVIDMSQNFLLIEMPHGIELKTPGLLSLNGRLTQIRQRTVGEGTEPI